MQMSGNQLFVFVEGKSDRYFYSQIVDLECSSRNINYIIVTARELSDTGGKQALLKFFSYLRRVGSLLDTFGRTVHASIFFLDKDIDDLLRTLKRSTHVVYTESYEVENYFFRQGDIAKAAAVSAGLDIASVQRGLAKIDDWPGHAAQCWKEWVVICLFCHTRLRGTGAPGFFGRPCSQFQNKAYEPTDGTLLGRAEDELFEYSSLDRAGFDRSMQSLRKRIDALFADGKHDRVFKGKWYCRFLREDILRIAKGRDIDDTRLHEKVLNSLAQSLNFDAEWTSHFREPVRVIVDKVMSA